MPDTRWSQSLESAVNRVLETMFFTCPDAPAQAAALEHVDSLGARLSFTGSAAGNLSVRLTPGVARSLAADFLGADSESVSAEQVTEVVCELANMICGSVVSELENQDLIHLSPAIPFASAAPAEVCAPSAEYAVELAGGLLLASVEVLERDGPRG